MSFLPTSAISIFLLPCQEGGANGRDEMKPENADLYSSRVRAGRVWRGEGERKMAAWPSQTTSSQLTTLSPTSSATLVLAKRYEERSEGSRNIMIVGSHPLIVTFDMCVPADIPRNIVLCLTHWIPLHGGKGTCLNTHHVEGTQECLEDYRKEHLILMTIFVTGREKIKYNFYFMYGKMETLRIRYLLRVTQGSVKRWN